MQAADSLIEQHLINVEAGPHYDDGTARPELPDPMPVRLVAFYLPQFHAIPENDEWWGPGFTEWTNVTKALPRFAGHYQPRLPGALGFYDLSDADALRRQAELARQYGIFGFCFHHYWFGGRRVLERPLENLLAHAEIEIPFCINWANENWTRTWDGSERSVLLGQQHSPEDDLAFARSLEPLFDDDRYIRIGGKPLMMLYRPSLLPDAKATVERWREHFASRGQEIFVTMAQAFDDDDPSVYGMDAAVGFPPHRTGARVNPIASSRLFDPNYGATLRFYDDMMRESIAYRPDGFRLFPGVCPSWDNEARRPGRGHAFVGSSPTKYGHWVEQAGRWIIDQAPVEERLVFINAWNEWAEGTYLEPDRHYGYAYLAEGARALARLGGGAGEQADFEALGELEQFRRLSFRREMARRAARVADWLAQKLRAV